MLFILLLLGEDKKNTSTFASEEAGRANERGKAAFAEKDFPKAIDCYEKALGWDPREMIYWSNLAAVMMQIKAFKEVRIIRRLTLGYISHSSASLIILLANAHF
jgi:tetratricopeptide (TPR) repeat protein